MKNRFLEFVFAPVDLYVLALMRITVGLSSFLYFLSFLPHLDLYYGREGFLSLAVSPLQGFSWQNISLLFLSDSIYWVGFCYFALLASSVTLTVGYKPQWSTFILWLTTISFVNRNAFVVTGVALLLLHLLLSLMFADTGRVLTRKTGPKIEASPVLGPYGWTFYLIRLELCIVYFQSGLYKLIGGSWTEGTALATILANPDWRRVDLSWFLNQNWFLEMLKVATTTVAVWELLFPLLVLWSKTRYPTLVFGLLLHLAHFATIEVGMFVPLLLASYLTFLPRDSVRKALLWFQRKVRARRTPARSKCD